MNVAKSKDTKITSERNDRVRPRDGAGVCVRLKDGRILTLEEARREFLKRYWNGEVVVSG